MNIGGVHIFFGLFYLVLITLLLFSYVLICYGIILFIEWFWRERDCHVKEIFQTLKVYQGLNKKNVRNCALVFLVLAIFNTAFYVNQRIDWMGDENAHFKAKEYYVAGQVLYLYRSVLTKIIHPDIFILTPFNWLQEKIYNSGKIHLPDDDGEIGIWTYQWLVYPYSKNFRLPLGYLKYTNKDQVAPMVVKLLDRSWFAIENLATKSIADRQMYEQQYLRNFAGMVHYYAYYEGYYTGSNMGSSFKLAKNSKYTQRAEKILIWLVSLKSKWKNSPAMQRFLFQEPDVAVMRQVAFAIKAHNLIIARIEDDRFSCSDTYLQDFQEMRREFANGENGISAIERMADNEKASKFSYVAMNSIVAKFDWWVLKKYCGIELAGNIDWSDEL